MRKIVIILIGAGLVCGVVFWLKQDLRDDALLTEHVTSFYRARGAVPASKEELVKFEQQMNLPKVASSYRKLEFTEPSEGMIRIVNSRGIILRSSGDHEVLVGKEKAANKPTQPTSQGSEVDR